MPQSLSALGSVGAELVRPECVLATAAGDLYTADWRGGVAHLRADGAQALYAGAGPDGLALRPNGIALLRDGSFLVAHLGADDGGVYRLWRDGRVEPWLMEVDGMALPPTNFVVGDAAGRFWITVSTRLPPRSLGYRRSGGDGFIVRVDGRGARIVADGLGYTNEVAVHPAGATCTSTRPLRAACRASRCTPTARSVPRRSSPTSAPARFPTAWPSTRTATPGWSASSATG